MADFDIVMEKIYGFESADELAGYLKDYGIKAQPMEARACAITVFVEAETGLEGSIVTTTTQISINETVQLEYGYEDTVVVASHTHTDAVRHFIKKFDSGHYPDLVMDGFEWAEGPSDYDCTCSECNLY